MHRLNQWQLKRGAKGKNQFFSRSLFGTKEQYVIIGITNILGLLDPRDGLHYSNKYIIFTKNYQNIFICITGFLI